MTASKRTAPDANGGKFVGASSRSRVDFPGRGMELHQRHRGQTLQWSPHPHFCPPGTGTRSHPNGQQSNCFVVAPCSSPSSTTSSINDNTPFAVDRLAASLFSLLPYRPCSPFPPLRPASVHSLITYKTPSAKLNPADCVCQ